MKTKLHWNSGYLVVNSPEVPEFEIAMNETDADLIKGICDIVFLEGKRAAIDELSAISKKHFGVN